MSIVPAIAQGISNKMDSAVEFLGNAIMTDKQNWENKMLWKEQMKYNSPVEQMKRLREAGLNPAMALGAGSKANVADSPPKVQVPEFHPKGFDASSILAGQQIKNAEAQHEVILTQNALLQEDLATKRHDNKINLGSPFPSNAPWFVKIHESLKKTGTGAVELARQLGLSIADIEEAFKQWSIQQGEKLSKNNPIGGYTLE